MSEYYGQVSSGPIADAQISHLIRCGDGTRARFLAYLNTPPAYMSDGYGNLVPINSAGMRRMIDQHQAERARREHVESQLIAANDTYDRLSRRVTAAEQRAGQAERERNFLRTDQAWWRKEAEKAQATVAALKADREELAQALQEAREASKVLVSDVAALAEALRDIDELLTANLARGSVATQFYTAEAQTVVRAALARVDKMAVTCPMCEQLDGHRMYRRERVYIGPDPGAPAGWVHYHNEGGNWLRCAALARVEER